MILNHILYIIFMTTFIFCKKIHFTDIAVTIVAGKFQMDRRGKGVAADQSTQWC